MRYIDKSTHREDGLKISSSFLEDNCKDTRGRYSGIRYDDRDSGTNPRFSTAIGGRYRKLMTRLLLDNQKSLCCYCLRKLKTSQDENESDAKLTIEHIIPRSYTSNDNVDYYRSRPFMQ